MILKEAAGSLADHLRWTKGIVAVAIGSDEIVVYTVKRKIPMPSVWEGHPVRVVRSGPVRPCT